MALVLTIAFAIGPAAAVFQIGASLTFASPTARLVDVWTRAHGGGYGTSSYLDFQDWAQRDRDFKFLAALYSQDYTISVAERTLQEPGAEVTANYFDTVGARAVVGRTFSGEGENSNTLALAVVSERFWRTELASCQSCVGGTITINGQLFTLIGVVSDPPGDETAVWTRLRTNVTLMRDRKAQILSVVGRLRRGVDIGTAQTEMTGIADAVRNANRSDDEAVGGILLRPYSMDMLGTVREPLQLISWILGLIFVIAGANAVVLVASRTDIFRAETATRLALGASRRQLLYPLLEDVGGLAVIGGGLALPLSAAAFSAARVWLPASLVAVADLRPAEPFGLALLTGLALMIGMMLGGSVLSAWRVSPAKLASGSTSAGNSGRGRAVGSLVAIEAAGATVLTLTAGLLALGLYRTTKVRLGFTPDNVLTVRVTLPKKEYSSPSTAAAFYRLALARLNHLPGVEATGLITLVPLEQSYVGSDFSVPGTPYGQELAQIRGVSDGYYSAMTISMIAGEFPALATVEPPAIVVNEKLARKFWPGHSAIGHAIIMGNQKFPIAAVVADVRQTSPWIPPGYEVDVPISSWPKDWPNLISSASFVLKYRQVRSDVLALTVEKAIASISPGVAISDSQSLAAVISSSLDGPRTESWVASILSFLGLVLACCGIFGTAMVYVLQARREVGIRMALGGQPIGEWRRLAWRTARWGIVGVIVGACAGLVLGRLAADILFEVPTFSFAVFSLVCAGICATVFLTAGGAAWHLVRAEPAELLRQV